MKKLIIVCEEKFKPYGDFLAQLISLEDDEADDIIGVKDGVVAAQVWTEKEYTANAAQISSEQYILFIGNSKLIKDKRLHMQKKFSEYGMQYCWLGKQSVLFVDKVVSIDEYDNFIEYAKGSKPEITKLIERKSDVMAVPEPTVENEKEEVNGFKKLLASMQAIPVAIVNAPVRGVNVFTKVTNNKKIEEQEYSCLVLIFYLKGLSEFLGLSEEQL
ncbi:hypothetical protein EAL2_808p02050 (plasmid) [Peptoclostridium acidaminophilum DSM 3953]|uniref:Uncharacterized protein n=1 Tax=Peptoclostridium acidaminophilum DSM 3953 TaxID=1286171 RepID=W8T9Z6_PEPAC|nr:hypothetical protein [Peptoclostridium acidaminophilum]AHM57710.1 hypothetical protein EAL2_808p02050 [Peptoclostridium acidaminophilum DSM 3953]